MISSVPPPRAVYKTSCWPCYWRLAQEALTFNWPPVCFELRPPITIPHKRGSVKPNCTWAWRGRARPSALPLMSLIALQEGPHIFLLAIETLIFEHTPQLTRNRFQFGVSSNILHHGH